MMQHGRHTAAQVGLRFYSKWATVQVSRSNRQNGEERHERCERGTEQ